MRIINIVFISSLIGEIIARFERKGFKLQAMKLYKPDRSVLEQHYGKRTYHL
jgi:nucleoside diphosphate kinase